MGLDVWAMERESGSETKVINPDLYFRDCYNDRSLANWLTRNVDSSARGEWGLAIFMEPALSLNSPEWRAKLLDLALSWTEKARTLRRKTTFAGYPEDPAILLEPSETEEFIEECEALLAFARIVHSRGLEVTVWG